MLTSFRRDLSLERRTPGTDSDHLMAISARSDEPIRRRIRGVLQNQWFMAAVILVTTIAIRWGFHLYNPRPTGFFMYRGSPVSDGISYTAKAISIANGYGIPPYAQPAIRPFYSIALACLYTWTGFSLSAVTALNIVIGGATATLIYLCGGLVLNRLCGLAAALFFAIDPTKIIQTSQAGSEPLGLLFFVGSVYSAMLAFQSGRLWMFFLSGLLIGLSNLTRTLIILTLPFYIALILLLGWRERILRSAAVRAVAILLGFCCIIVPWLIRQDRLYGIATISDNIGEAIYAASSPVYKQWTTRIRKDADAAGIPNTVGDRYRYFMERAVENVKANPMFYVRNVATSFWEYANTFGLRSRTGTQYGNPFSSAAEGQRLLLPYVILFTVAIWLLWKDRPFAPSSLAFLLSSIALVICYRLLPVWATFAPILLGIVVSWRAGHRKLVLIASGSLAAGVVGSAVFANPVLYRTVLMIDWLFLFFFLAAVWFPAEIVSRQFAGSEPLMLAHDREEGKSSPFQQSLSLSSVRFLVVFSTILLGFFAVSSARLVALTISRSGKDKQAQFVPEWVLRQSQARLTIADRKSVLMRLQSPPFSVLPRGDPQFSIRSNENDPFTAGTYVVEIDGFYYDYYVPPGESLWAVLKTKPYGRTLARLPRFDFVIRGEVPADFAGRPLLFVGVVASQDDVGGEQTNRPWVRGLAIIPLDNDNRPDYASAVCAAPTS